MLKNRHVLMLSIIGLLAVGAGGLEAAQVLAPGRLDLEAVGDEVLMGSFSTEKASVEFQVMTSPELLEIVISGADGGPVLLRSRLDLEKEVEQIFLGQYRLHGAEQALSWLRSPEARAFADVWRSLQVTHSHLLGTPAGKTLSYYSIHTEAAIGALGSKTDAELVAELFASEKESASVQNPARQAPDLFGAPESCGFGNECTGCCGFGCSCNFGCTNYCYRHDLCCDIHGWGHCFSSCYAAAAVLTGGPYPTGD